MKVNVIVKERKLAAEEKPDQECNLRQRLLRKFLVSVLELLEFPPYGYLAESCKF